MICSLISNISSPGPEVVFHGLLPFDRLDTIPCLVVDTSLRLSSIYELVILSQIFEGLGFCKAPTVTTGVPGSTFPDTMELHPKNTEDSPGKVLSPLSSIVGPLPSLKLIAGLREPRTSDHDQLRIAMDVKGSTDTDSAADSELCRLLRRNGTEESKVRICDLYLFSTACLQKMLSKESQA